MINAPADSYLSTDRGLDPKRRITVCAVTIPLPGSVPDAAYEKLPRSNEIDELVWKKLKLLGMLPSPAAGDTTFHRRAYLRAIGRLPTPEETRAFLADTSAA